MNSIQARAIELLNMGFSVIPVAANKKSMGTWKEYTKTRMTPVEAEVKFKKAPALAIICGEVSGNLELIDVDDVDCWEPLVGMITLKHPETVKNIVFCKTPHGFGLAYRHTCIPEGNLKFASKWVEVPTEGKHQWNGRGEYVAKEHNGKWYISPTAVESRGESGYFLSVPSPSYSILKGSFSNLEPIAPEIRESLVALARSFDEVPKELQSRPGAKFKKTEERKHIPYPGDIYDQIIDFPALIQEHGWVLLYVDSQGVTQFAREGREDKKKIGASLYPDGKFHVFTSNAAPLKDGKQYSAFAFLTAYSYDGDFSESTKAIAAEGYVPDLTKEDLHAILKDNPDETVRAYRNSGLTESDVSEVLISLGIPLPEGKRAGRVEIEYDLTCLNSVVEQADKVLTTTSGGSWGFYSFCDTIGYVNSANYFVPYDVDSLELRCEQSLFMSGWTTPKDGDKAELKPIRTPSHILRKILNYPASTAPFIKGFASHPTMVRTPEDKWVVTGLTDGLSHDIMFKSKSEWTVDKRSWKECYDFIVDTFCTDILFANKEGGQALFVSMMLTAVARLGLDGGCPGYFITANEPGTGKSTLFEFVSRIVYGELVESVDWGTDNNERRKEIIAHLKDGIECFLFDNIKQCETVESPILAQAITAGSFRSRILGRTEMVTIQAQSLFVFAGNNLNMSTELSRRLMTIELIANLKNPYSRRVKIKNVADFCAEKRGEVMGCLLKMLIEGVNMADNTTKSTGFSYWTRVVMNPILVQTGLDITKGFEASQASSAETTGVDTALALLADVFGIGGKFTTKDVFLAIARSRELEDAEILQADEIKKGVEDACRLLRDELDSINGLASKSVRSLGRVLSSLENRISDDFRFVRHKTKSKSAVKCWIESTNQPSTAQGKEEE